MKKKNLKRPFIFTQVKRGQWLFFMNTHIIPRRAGSARYLSLRPKKIARWQVVCSVRVDDK